MVRKIKGRKLSESKRIQLRAEIREELGISEEEEKQIFNYINFRENIGDKRSFEELFQEGYIKLIEEDNLRRAKKREQLRKDLEITEEEEKEIYNYIREEERKGSSKSFNDLFKEGYFKLMDKKEMKKNSNKNTYLYSSERKDIKVPTRADLHILKEENRKKLGDNKTEKFTMRISEKEKCIIEELKASGINFTDEVRKLILTLDKNISRDYFQEEWESLQEEISQIEIDIISIQEKIRDLKEMEEKSQEIINNIELYKYNIIDLRREKRRIEKHLEKYKIIFEWL